MKFIPVTEEEKLWLTNKRTGRFGNNQSIVIEFMESGQQHAKLDINSYHRKIDKFPRYLSGNLNAAAIKLKLPVHVFKKNDDIYLKRTDDLYKKGDQ